MNKKFRNLLICTLIAAAVLTGCGAVEPTEPSETVLPTAAPTEAPTEAPMEAPTEPPTEAPTEPPVLRNPFNGEIVDAVYTQRPYAFSINNVKPSMPQYGIGQADIVYEMLVEYGLTRCLAIYSDVSQVEKIGSIRSARIYTYSLVQSCDAILVRCGGSSEADEAIKNGGWDDINGYYLSEPFYRDQDRRNAGYALEHTMFTSGPLVLENTEKRSLRTTHEGGLDYGLNFAGEAVPDGETADSISLVFSSSKSTSLGYDADSGKYLASQYGQDWIDNITGETLAFENVLILRARTWTQEDDIHESIELVGEGDGYYANGGKLIPIHWSRSADSAPFIYTCSDGSPLTIGVGKSYIGIIPTNADVSWK